MLLIEKPEFNRCLFVELAVIFLIVLTGCGEQYDDKGGCVV